MTKKLKLSTVVCICFVLFAAFYFIQALGYRYWNSSFAPGPGFIPQWTGGGLLVLSIVATMQSFKQEGNKLSDILPKGLGRKNIITCWIALLFFAFFAETLGFIVTSTVMLTVLFNLGIKKWYKAFIIGLLVTLCCYLIFNTLLQVHVPANIFGW